jgi:hypothetical protein
MAYTLGGNVTGSGYVFVYLKVNGAVVEGKGPGPGAFTFTTQLNAGDSYAVLGPNISNPSGTIGTSNVTNVGVSAPT